MAWRNLVLALAAWALAACDERVTPAPASAAAAVAGCTAHASAPWRPLRGAAFQVTADADGGDCTVAAATMSISDASGRVLFEEAMPANEVMTLAYAESAQAMQVALAEWIDPTRANIRATSELPVWVAGDEQPVLGEFPFYPERAFDREAYAALRARDVPLFCFVQGMESLACLALENGALTKVGVQTFPG